MTAIDRFDDLVRTCQSEGTDAMLDALVASLAARQRWHALFDTRIAWSAWEVSPVGGHGGP